MNFKLESFDSFTSKKPTKPAKKKVNEGLFSKNRGKEVLVGADGKTHKLKWKEQGDGNFIVKLVNDLDIIDNNERITPEGQQAIAKFLNGEQSFSPKWDPVFFKENFIAYTVKRDTPRTQKIQFTNKTRAEFGEAVGPNINFISTQELNDANLYKTQQGLLNTEVEEPEATDATDITATNPNEVISDNHRGKSFKHMFNTIKQEAIFTITETGSFHFEGITNQEVDGTVNYVQNKSIISPEGNIPGITGSTEIVDSADVAFFNKAFTDEAFLKRLIDEHEAAGKVTAFDGTFTLENIKKYLYDEETNEIFTDA